MAVEVSKLPTIGGELEEAPFFTFELIKHLLREGFTLTRSYFRKDLRTIGIDMYGVEVTFNYTITISQKDIALVGRCNEPNGQGFPVKKRRVLIKDSFNKAYGEIIDTADGWTLSKLDTGGKSDMEKKS